MIHKSHLRPKYTGFPVLILFMTCLAFPHPGSAQVSSENENPEALPEKVSETYQRIKAAAQSGDAGELQAAMEWNELPPETNAEDGVSPLDHWKQAFGDPSLRAVMATILNILEAGHVKLNGEGGAATYIWPYHAKKDLTKLTPTEEVDLLRIIPSDGAKAMKQSGKYSGYTLVIGADGTWHSFAKANE